MKNYLLMVPTYKRKEPKILRMLQLDPNVEINLCVRSDEYDNGFYDELEKIDRINIIKVGYNVIDLGDTRERMMQYAVKNNIKYVIMLDDTIDNIYDTSDALKSISQCLEECVNRLETDKMKELCIMYQFHRPERKHCISDKDNKEYFVCCPVQGYIINTELYSKYDLHFHTYEEAGSEDESFFTDTLKLGLLTCSNTKINMSGDLPAVKKEGGTHEDKRKLEEIADFREEKFVKYVGNMYGVYLTKRYRTNIGCLFSLATFNYDYFYDVLVKRRDKNEKIIKSQFKY